MSALRFTAAMSRSRKVSIHFRESAADNYISLPQDCLATLNRHLLLALGNSFQLVSSASVRVSIDAANRDERIHDRLVVVVRDRTEYCRGLREQDRNQQKDDCGENAGLPQSGRRGHQLTDDVSFPSYFLLPSARK